MCLKDFGKVLPSSRFCIYCINTLLSSGFVSTVFAIIWTIYAALGLYILNIFAVIRIFPFYDYHRR